MTARASIIIRCKNEARDIGTVLCAVLSQEGVEPPEIIAVDSGSTDGTLEVLARFPVRVIRIPPESFTFGRALNVGCQAAGGEVLVSLSAHVYPRGRHWLASHLRHFDDSKVAATSRGETLLVQDAEGLRRNPYVGYDNSNGAFRAGLWRERPFDEAMGGTEDREWAYHFQRQGYVVVCDPAVDALHEHPVPGAWRLVRDRWTRAYREHVGFARFLPAGVLLRALAARARARGLPRNREGLAWYLGACAGILRG